MTTCPNCGETFDPAELTRHEHGGLVVVHCPDCKCVLGRYNAHTR